MEMHKSKIFLLLQQPAPGASAGMMGSGSAGASQHLQKQGHSHTCPKQGTKEPDRKFQ